MGWQVLLPRTCFFFTGSGGFKIAGTDILKDIKNSRPNWRRGQFSKKNITTTFKNVGSYHLHIINKLMEKKPESPLKICKVYYCNILGVLCCKNTLFLV